MFDFAVLSASFGGFIWPLFSFVLALSLIVSVHEYGHYIVGRWCGIHAEVFSVGFGTVLLSRVDKHGTRWQIAALPFGGYVKFKADSNPASAPDGVILNSLDTTELRRTMHGAPIWARAATAAAGPAFNFILSIILFCALFMWQGQFTDKLKINKMFSLPGDFTLELGDEITAVNGLNVNNFEEFIAAGQDLQAPVSYTVKLDGRRVEARGPVPFPAVVSQVQPLSAAIEAGIIAGDVIKQIDGQPISDFADLKRLVAAADGDAMMFSVWRLGKEFDVVLRSKSVAVPGPEGSLVNRRLVGISGDIFFEPGTKPLAFTVAIAGAVKTTWGAITWQLVALKQMIKGSISTCNLSGPVDIAKVAGQMASQGVVRFVNLIAGLSVAVGLMNLFPIPILDGGHLVFCAYEAITGRKPNDSVLQFLMTFGLIIVLSLTVFAVIMNQICP